jgi:hypothetical protein
MTRLAVLALALLACACSDPVQTPLADEGTPVTAHSVSLFPDTPEVVRLGVLDWRGGVELTADDERFGGLSALEVSEDGMRLLAVSDSAWWVRTHLLWSDAGELTGLSDLVIAPLRDASGAHLIDRAGDSEGLADLGGGRYAVSFERDHRIWCYDIGEDWSRMNRARPNPMETPPTALPIPNNGGMEALTLLGDGSLLVGLEWPFSTDTLYDLWQQREGGWRQMTMSAATEHGLTGMTVIDGQVYALERYWTPAVGSRVRVIRFAESALDSDQAIEPELLAEFDAANTVDNYEGITAFHRDGETILLIVSDDNFSQDQRTLLLAFAVTG